MGRKGAEDEGNERRRRSDENWETRSERVREGKRKGERVAGGWKRVVETPGRKAEVEVPLLRLASLPIAEGLHVRARRRSHRGKRHE